jgi:hypothetical protein
MKRSDAGQAAIVLVSGVVMATAGHMLWFPRQSDGSWGLERILGLGVSVAGMVVVAAWLFTLVVALVAASLEQRGQHTAARITAHFTPAVMRRLAAALLGLNLLAAPAVAQAAPPGAGVAPASPRASAGGAGRSTPRPTRPSRLPAPPTGRVARMERTARRTPPRTRYLAVCHPPGSRPPCRPTEDCWCGQRAEPTRSRRRSRSLPATPYGRSSRVTSVHWRRPRTSPGPGPRGSRPTAPRSVTIRPSSSRGRFFALQRVEGSSPPQR